MAMAAGQCPQCEVRARLMLGDPDEKEANCQDQEPAAATPQDAPVTQEDPTEPEPAKDNMEDDGAPADEGKRQREDDAEASPCRSR